MKRLGFTVIILLSLALVLGACARVYFDKYMYFDGAVVVEYQQNKLRGTNDFLTLTFYEKGTYNIHFQKKAGWKQGSKVVAPQDFKITIEAVPREYIITQYVLPDFLTVTIGYNGAIESHEFK